MTKKEIEQHVANTIRKAADSIDPKLNQVEPPKPETTEAAQEAHEAAETSFQTRRLGSMNVSLNSHPDAKKVDDDE